MKNKKFDCVKMKHEIQRQILEETRGMTPEQRRRQAEQAIESDPILAHLWRHARRIQPSDSPVITS